jgi:protein FrlC
MSLKLGLCTMIYLDYATLEDAIERTAKFGYQAIDIWADSPHLDPLSRDIGYRQEIKKQCRDRGLEIVALSVNGGALARRYNFSYCKDWVRKETIDYYKKCVDLAAEIGCPAINMISGHMMAGTHFEQAWQWNREGMSEVAKHAEKCRVTLALHTLAPSESRVIVTLDDSLKMMNEINSKSCRLMIDTADQNITDPHLSDSVRKVAKHLVYVHISDNSGSGEGLVHNVPGKGTINWKMFIRVLKEVGYSGYLTAQLNCGVPIDPDAWVWETYEYMSRLIQESSKKTTKR